jgi:hypothetical protein
MATFAVMSGNTVSNVVMSDSQQDAELATGSICIEYTTDNPAGIGWTYDESTGIFSPPVQNN